MARLGQKAEKVRRKKKGQGNPQAYKPSSLVHLRHELRSKSSTLSILSDGSTTRTPVRLETLAELLGSEAYDLSEFEHRPITEEDEALDPIAWKKYKRM